MGGHADGDVASRLAVDTLLQFFERATSWEDGAIADEVSSSEHFLMSAMRLANMKLYWGGVPDPKTGIGMGSTLVAAMFDEAVTEITVGHVGDSRAYRLRGAVLERLTTDHSMREEVETGAPQNVLTRALGVGADVEVTMAHGLVEVGDTYLLCSDGLWGRATDAEITSVLRRARTPEIACYGLVALANEHGGGDNISVAIARVEEIDPPRVSGPVRR
jgi:protein phosphatase